MAVDLSFHKSHISEEIRGEGREEGRAGARLGGVPQTSWRFWMSERIFSTSRTNSRSAAGRGPAYECPSSSVSSSAVAATDPESGTGRSGNGSTRVSSMTGEGGCGGRGMTAASEWPPQP